MKRICVVVTARASWAKLEPVCRALRGRCELQLVVCASALLERYGKVIDVIKAEGYAVAAEVWSTLEGATLVTSAKETGGLASALSDVLSRLRPDLVVACADRHEVLAVALVAANLHLQLVHCQGGERSGSIDDKIRDAVTCLADIHFPCTAQAADRVRALTGSSSIYAVGCPSIDLAREAQTQAPVTAEELGGAGAWIDLRRPFGIVLQHPVTTEAAQAYAQMGLTLNGVFCVAPSLPVLVFWPGEDAGADAMSKAIRETQAWVHTVRNLPPLRFLRLLSQASVLVGNSSAGIREASSLGVPVVDIGSRQQGRECADNVLWSSHDASEIASAIQRQITHGPYPSSPLYGTGDAGPRIAERLLTYGDRTDPGPDRIEMDRREEYAALRGTVADESRD